MRAALACCAAVLSLAACTSSHSATVATSPRVPVTQDPVSSSGAPTSSPPAPSPTTRPTHAYPPAAGPKIVFRTLSFRLPVGYRLKRSLGPGIVLAHRKGVSVVVDDLPTSADDSTNKMAVLAQGALDYSRRPRRAPDVTIDGTRFYHLDGPVGSGRFLEEYGCVHRRRSLSLTLLFHNERVPRKRIAGSVLATVRVR